MTPTIFTTNKVKLATASSLESYLGMQAATKNKSSALEEDTSVDAETTDARIDEGDFAKARDAETNFFLASSIANLLIDGRLLFSENPEEAYEQLLLALERPEVRMMVMRELKSAKIFDNVSAYNVLNRRCYQTELEASRRRKALDNFREQIVAERPELKDKLD